MIAPMQDPTIRTRRIRRLAVASLTAVALVAGAIVLFAIRSHRARPSTGAPMAAMPATASAGADTGRMSKSVASTQNGAAVQLTASQIRQFGITFGTAARRPLDNTVRTVGTVAVDEARRSQVAPRFAGYVERLYVDQTGQRVRRGEALMDVYSPELLAAEQELLIAGTLDRSIGESSVPGVPSTSTDLVTAARRRLQLWDISDSQIEDILRTGKVRRTLTLHAPASGVVLQKNVVRGQAIQAGQMLYDIADLSDVWIDVALREADAGMVRIGSTAMVQLVAYPGHAFKGRVAYVYPTLDTTTRTLRARIEVANRDGRIKPGMYATVVLSTPLRTALTVPNSAVLRTGERALVFIDMGNGRLEPREIQPGRVTDSYTEVIAGVEPGQRVVTSAQFLLDSESNLAEVMKGMIGQGGAGDTANGQDMKGMSMPPDRR